MLDSQTIDFYFEFVLQLVKKAGIVSIVLSTFKEILRKFYLPANKIIGHI